MKFINFNSDKEIEQLTHTQLTGLIKLEQGNRALFTDCDELKVVLLSYDTGERLCTEAAGRLATKNVNRYFEVEQNNLIAVVGESQVVPSANLKQTQIAIFDKHMRVILDLTFNSDISIDKVVEDITKGQYGKIPARSRKYNTREAIENDFVIEALCCISKKSKILYPLFQEKTEEIKHGQSIYNLYTFDQLETEEETEA